MAAGFVECVLAGLVPLLLAAALMARSAVARPVPARLSPAPVGATRRR
jgi:hypothetical protein